MSHGAVGAAFARAVSVAASFALSVSVARSLNVIEAGRFFVIFALINGAATVGRFGIDNLVLKSVASDSARARQWAIDGLRAILGPAIAMSMLMFLAARSGLLGGGLSAYEPIAASVSVLASSLAVFAGAVYRGSGRVGIGTFAELGATAALASAGIASLGLVSNVGLSGALCCYALASVLTATWSIPLCLSGLDGCAQRTKLSVFWRSHGQSLVSFATTSLGFYLLAWIPVLVLGLLGEAQQAAYFSVAARVCGLMNLVPSVQISYLSPRFAKQYRERDLVSANALAKSAVIRSSLAALPFVAVSLVAPRILLVIFGPKYPAASPALACLCVTTFLTILAGPVNAMVMTCGLERLAGRFVVVLLALSVFGGVAVVSQGAWAVALITGALNAVYAWGCVTALRRRGLVPDLLPVGRDRRP